MIPKIHTVVLRIDRMYMKLLLLLMLDVLISLTLSQKTVMYSLNPARLRLYTRYVFIFVFTSLRL